MKTNILYCLIFLVGSFGAKAQSDILLYHFDALGQTTLVNPAMPQKNRLVIGVPGATQVSFFADAGIGSVNQLAGPDAFNGNDAIKAILDRNSPQSAIRNSLRYDPIFIGFKSGRIFWSFGTSIRQEFFTRFPYNLVDLAYYGNATPGREDVEIGDLRTTAWAVTDWHAGAQMQFFKKKLTLGARAHYLVGLAMADLRSSSLRLQSGLDSWTLESDIVAQFAVPQALMDQDFDYFTDYRNLLLNNRGFAMDLGFHYKLNRRWAFSGSLNDFGGITWNENALTYSSSGRFVYEGFNINPAGDGSLNPGAIVDSLTQLLELNNPDSAAIGWNLPYNVFFGTTFRMSRRHTLAVLVHYNSVAGLENNQYFVQYYGHLTNWLQLVGSYRISSLDQFGTLGAGVAVKTLWSAQFYLMLQNVAMVYQPFDQQSIGLNFGLNIAIRGKREKWKKDSPSAGS
jgi:hypothetical protein